ncbi:baseplate J/gp47 family protein [Cupriavidus metallidurans]|uniref:Baseplate protein n=1 Tax=Cupriavidus metallidurans TaxID=119219 RepID=A0A482ISU8_9BURK|nr:baseplate J/gp47 family protein [Cupriavidus metallidurans]QBP09860.1 baseplate protein [Cupriavidus metallidurans]
MTERVVLPPPVYIETDPAVILRELVTEWETLTKKPLYPGQAEMLFINNRAYREALLRQQVQGAAKKNLVRFADEPILDYLGELVDVQRLPAQPARTTMRLAMPAPVTQDLLVRAGLVIGSDDGQVEFETQIDVTIPAGGASADVGSICLATGIAGNGYRPGRISELSGTYPDGLTATNIEITDNGTEREDSERYRDRIIDAPAGFSVAGPQDAYEFFAKGAHQDICDVRAVSPVPCVVEVYVLTVNGPPTKAMRDLVLSSINGKKRRPLSDAVSTPEVQQVDYAIKAELTLLTGADPDLTLAAAKTAINLWLYGDKNTVGRERMLGADIVPYQIKAAFKVPGIYDVQIPSLAGTIVVPESVWAHCTSLQVNLVGTANG